MRGWRIEENVAGGGGGSSDHVDAAIRKAAVVPQNNTSPSCDGPKLSVAAERLYLSSSFGVTNGFGTAVLPFF